MPGIQQSGQRGKGAAPVVLSVGEHHAPVHPAFPRPSGRHDLQLRRQEILLLNLVGFRQNLQDMLLYILLPNGLVSDQQVHLLRVKEILDLLLIPLSAKMGQQIRDHEHRIVFLLAHGQADRCPVLSDDDPVQRQRKRKPLVFFDAAVVVGIQVNISGFLVAGNLFQVQTRGIDVRSDDVHPLFQRICADPKKGGRLLHEGEINLVAGTQGLSFMDHLQQILVSCLPCHADSLCGTLPLRFSCIQKTAVSNAQFSYRRQIFLMIKIPCVFSLHTICSFYIT